MASASGSLLPDLVLQEAHVSVEQGVGRRQDPYRLHPRSSLYRALHSHVGEAGQAKVVAFPEVAADRGEGRWTKPAMTQKHRHCQMAGIFFFFLPGNSFCCSVLPGEDMGLHPNISDCLSPLV